MQREAAHNGGPGSPGESTDGDVLKTDRLCDLAGTSKVGVASEGIDAVNLLGKCGSWKQQAKQ